MHPAVKFLAHLDRRWIFLLMGIAVMVPVVARMQCPEVPSPLVLAVFDRIESLPEGSRILFPFDYDPGSAPELQPMATALTWHCAKKKHKLFFMALWPLGPQMIQNTIDEVIKVDFPDYEYGVDYVNLGFKSGNEAVIKVVTSNLRELYTSDHGGVGLNEFEMTRDLTNIRDMDLILNCSAGYPGTKEWIQYAATPFSIPIASGCTGVQAPLLYPYIPHQMFGILGAIKGAAEYEEALSRVYPEYAQDADGNPRVEFTRGIQRMGPQLIAHCLILLLIVLGNVILVLSRRAREAA